MEYLTTVFLVLEKLAIAYLQSADTYLSKVINNPILGKWYSGHISWMNYIVEKHFTKQIVMSEMLS